jgi:hypothetical protein
MPAIDAAASDYQFDHEDRFWRILNATLSRVMRDELGLAERYRASLANASRLERLLALHDDPIDIAASLTGVRLSDEHLVQYDEILAQDALERFRAAEGMSPTDEPVTLGSLDFVFGQLGYARVQQKSELLVEWERVIQAPADTVFFPRTLTLLVPHFWAERYSEPVYDKSHLIYMLTHGFPNSETGERLRRTFTEAINSIE